MNIYFITRFYPPDTGGGGIASYTRYIATGLFQRGHQVRVISQFGPEAKSSSFQRIDGIEVYRLPTFFTSYGWRRLPILGRHLRFFRNLIYAVQVRQALKYLAGSSYPDIVEYADVEAEGLFHPSICPHVVKLHTPHEILRPYYNSHQVGYARYGIEKSEARSIRRADGLSSPSKWLALKVASLYGLDSTVISWVPNPIDTDLFSPGQETNLDIPPLVLYVGRLEPLKGALVFAQAIPSIAQACPETRFVFLGADRPDAAGTSQKAELEICLEKAGLRNRVEFYGHASPETFRDFYRRATVFVMPSLLENCPYTLLEAMACGKPVVVSRAGGMAEIINEDENGLLFEPGDSAALARRTIELLSSTPLRAKLGRAARETVLQKYSLDVGAEATERFYQNVLA